MKKVMEIYRTNNGFFTVQTTKDGEAVSMCHIVDVEEDMDKFNKFLSIEMSEEVPFNSRKK